MAIFDFYTARWPDFIVYLRTRSMSWWWWWWWWPIPCQLLLIFHPAEGRRL